MSMMWWNWLRIGGSYLGDHGHWGFTERKLRCIRLANTAISLPSDAPASDRLISVHGMMTDTKDRLWVIDDLKKSRSADSARRSQNCGLRSQDRCRGRKGASEAACITAR
jgi:hypothetical protein